MLFRISSLALIFQSGFAIGNTYWDRIVEFFRSRENANDVSIFFLDKVSDIDLSVYDYVVGIGHSLGFVKLIMSGIEFDAIVGIQAFVNFCGQEHRIRLQRLKELDEMYERLQRDASSELARFYAACGLSEISDTLMETCCFDELCRDFKLLYRDDIRFPSAASLQIYSRFDGIVPNIITLSDFGLKKNVTISLVNHMHHNLGYDKHHMVANLILEYISCIKRL